MRITARRPPLPATVHIFVGTPELFHQVEIGNSDRDFVVGFANGSVETLNDRGFVVPEEELGQFVCVA